MHSKQLLHKANQMFASTLDVALETVEDTVSEREQLLDMEPENQSGEDSSPICEQSDSVCAHPVMVADIEPVINSCTPKCAVSTPETVKDTMPARKRQRCWNRVNER